MTSIAATSSTGATSTSVSQTRNDHMDQSDFLRLLTTQMQTQDPFNPMSNGEMVAQMATITNSSGIAEMNATLKSIAGQLGDNRLGGAASWIGHSMLVQSNIAAPDAAGQYMGKISLGAAASDVSVDLVDGAGSVVKTIALGARDAGDASFYWDGKDADGNTLATTPLQVRVRGATPNSIATWASIAAVQSPADGTTSKLITALGSYDPSDALELA